MDGLHGVHEKQPDLSPADEWKRLFTEEGAKSSDDTSFSPYFTPSKELSHKEILRLLREEPADSVTLVTMGPMTNAALAAAEDPETFLKLKELVVMGGAVHVEGNITPVGEFNTYADAVAAARIYALTSPIPASTMPPVPKSAASLPDYPKNLSRRLRLTLFPLDITTPHLLNKTLFNDVVREPMEAGSPLARWVNSFMTGVYNHIDSMVPDGTDPGLSLHDPMTIWYMLCPDDPAWKPSPHPEDIRIETAGQWTRGMHITDKRGRARKGDEQGEVGVVHAHFKDDPRDDVELEIIPDDNESWLDAKKGNRITRMISSPGEDVFAGLLMRRGFA